MRLMVATLLLAGLTALGHGLMRSAAFATAPDASALAMSFTGQ